MDSAPFSQKQAVLSAWVVISYSGSKCGYAGFLPSLALRARSAVYPIPRLMPAGDVSFASYNRFQWLRS
jgi:hypothetical protein